MGDFGEAERKIAAFMAAGEEFDFNGQHYKIIFSGKPTCYKGEPKTDIYILAECNAKQIEIKISYKKKNADFIENKMTAERAKQLFGADWEKVIEKSTKAVEEKFAERILIYKKPYKRTEKGAITLGWKFELMNKSSGDLSGKMFLSKEQIMDVYAGSNLSDDKKNATVCGKIIQNSGIANYILIEEDIQSTQDVIDKMILIKDYVEMYPNIYFACKALNYRSFKKKWDGDRPLSVQVEWSEADGKLVPRLVYDRPLSVRGNEVVSRLLTYMRQLNIENTDDINCDNTGTDRIV